jgi:uncharacterized membrane protein
MKLARIEALSDGIFAIVMTLLILEIKVPALHGHDVAHLSQELFALWPKFISFIVSFVVIGVYWTSHHIQFSYLKRTDFNHIWRNIATLFFISLIPFSAALLGEYPFEQMAQAFYALNLIFTALSLYRAWVYAIADNRLADPGDISAELRKNARHKMLLPALIYSVAILLSFIDTRVSLALFVLGPAIYFIPVDSRLWGKISKPVATGG